MLAPGGFDTVPRVNPHATPEVPRLIDPYLPRQTLTGQPLRACAAYTAEHAKMVAGAFELFQYSLSVFNGTRQRPSDWVGMMAEGFVALAAPTLGVIGLVRGLPRTVAGAAGVVVLGTANVVERCGYAVSDQFKHRASAPIAMEQRRYLTNQFINRMLETLPTFDDHEAAYFKTEPKQLINLAAMIVAFLSRGLEGDNLKVGLRMLSEGSLKAQDNYRKSYFFDLCEAKKALQNLSLSPDDDHAWVTLSHLIANFKLDTSELEKESDGWNKIIGPQDYVCLARAQNASQTVLTPGQIDNLALIYFYLSCFSEKVAGDKVFKEMWAARVNVQPPDKAPST
jgi:hypothetical protein